MAIRGLTDTCCHICATLLLAAGENAKVVSERLGHTKVAFTLDRYGHVMPGMQEKAAGKLEAGKSVRWVADQLGHADPALTLRVYAHSLKGEERDLSFAEFGPRRPYTVPRDTDSDHVIAPATSQIQAANEKTAEITRPNQPNGSIVVGGPPGTRTLDHLYN